MWLVPEQQLRMKSASNLNQLSTTQMNKENTYKHFGKKEREKRERGEDKVNRYLIEARFFFKRNVDPNWKNEAEMAEKASDEIFVGTSLETRPGHRNT